MRHKKLNQDEFHIPPGTPLYNVCFKGGTVQGRMTIRGFEGLRPEQIDWVWIVDEMRRGTPDEIRKVVEGSRLMNMCTLGNQKLQSRLVARASGIGF